MTIFRTKAKPPQVTVFLRTTFLTVLILSFFLLARAYAGSFEVIYGFQSAVEPQPSLVLGGDDAFYGTTERGGIYGCGSVFRVTTNGTFTTLFSFAQTNGANPEAGLVLGNDGAFYGTTSKGGSATYSYGTVFRVTTNGLLTTLVQFTGETGLYPGSVPQGLTLGSDGALYGTTVHGGPGGSFGTIFRVRTNGTFTLLATFGGSNGSLSYGKLVQAPDGSFYGTTSIGGSSGHGTVFRVTTTGSLSTIASFNSTNGALPMAGLTFNTDGALYGTTYYGGLFGYGTVFQVTTNGLIYTLKSFNFNFSAPNDGYNPRAGLLQLNGVLYGSTQSGGQYSAGTLFRISSGPFTNLVSFNGTNGNSPLTELTLGRDGALYGLTGAGGAGDNGTLFRYQLDGNLSVVTSFINPEGTAPRAGLMQTSNGMLYGTTSKGGSNGLGTLFRADTNGAVTTLASFNGTNGSFPGSPLIMSSDGSLYGTTQQGGTNSNGTLFRADTNGVITSLFSFNRFVNGAGPGGSLAIGSDGALYGTTASGGAASQGTVFRFTTNGSFQSFPFDGSNGAFPQAGIIRGQNGDFYGTTTLGGANNAGTVFTFKTNGAITALVSFNPVGGNGMNSRGTLVQTRNGALYGTTYYTGPNNAGYGTVFRVTTNGIFTRLATFASPASGYAPEGPLVEGRDGALYGTTISGGKYGSGTVFRITTNGALSTIASFNDYNSLGANPFGGLLLAVDGNFYGITSGNGKLGGGTIFRLDTTTKMDPLSLGSSNVGVRFTGIPDTTYQILRATSPAGPWSLIATTTVISSGSGYIIDSHPPTGMAFYRVDYY